MFEAVNKMTMSVQGGNTVKPPQVVVPAQTVDKTADKSASNNVLPMELTKQATEQKAAEEKQARKDQQVTEEMLKELEQDIEAMHNVELRFSKHNDTGRTMIKVMDKENDEIIREIPAEEVLNLAAKIEEMIGILFDTEV
jgi:flagellar protein FlaG